MKAMLVLLGLGTMMMGSAMGATIVSQPWGSGGELNLYQIVNALYGTGFTSNTQMDFAQLANDEIFALSNVVKAEARYAGNDQTIGWYQFTGSGSPVVFNDLFTVTGSGLGDLGSGIISASGNYGFYDLTGPASNPSQYRWFSEADENAGEDHMVTYDLAALTGSSAFNGHLLVGWEDLPLSISDTDYQDVVLEVSSTPEPATIVLMGIGAAMAALRRFRKVL